MAEQYGKDLFEERLKDMNRACEEKQREAATKGKLRRGLEFVIGKGGSRSAVEKGKRVATYTGLAFLAGSTVIPFFGGAFCAGVTAAAVSAHEFVWKNPKYRRKIQKILGKYD